MQLFKSARKEMELLSWNAAVATGSIPVKTLKRPPPRPSEAVSGYSAVTWRSNRGSHSMRVAAADKILRPPLLGWDLPDVWKLPPNLPPCPALSDENLAVEPIATVIDGKAIAQEIRREVSGEISRMRDAVGKVPGLAVVLVGARKDSETYVRSKKKACEEVGIMSVGIDLPEEASEDEVLRAVMTFNNDPSVHGVLVQLPLPQRHNATVTIVHSYTKNAADITREADIVISAAGVANLVRGEWLKPGAVVIDVGINPVEDHNSKRGYRLVGDVCYEEASRIVSAITPVPGGVGPMTIAMLLSNTLDSAKRAFGLH